MFTIFIQTASKTPKIGIYGYTIINTDGVKIIETIKEVENIVNKTQLELLAISEVLVKTKKEPAVINISDESLIRIFKNAEYLKWFNSNKKVIYYEELWKKIIALLSKDVTFRLTNGNNVWNTNLSNLISEKISQNKVKVIKGTY